MATRSTITLSTKDSYKSIYCHFDGYTSRNGTILTKHYNTQDKVEKLIALGSLSSLGERIAPSANEKHTWKIPTQGVTVAYHRDRGDELVINKYQTLQDLSHDLEDYNYLFENDNWYLLRFPTDAPVILTKLDELFAYEKDFGHERI